MKKLSITTLLLIMFLDHSHSALLAHRDIDLCIFSSTPVEELTVRTVIFRSRTDQDRPQKEQIVFSPLRKGNRALTFFVNAPTPFEITEIDVSCEAIFPDRKVALCQVLLGDCNRILVCIDKDSEGKTLRISGWPRDSQKVYLSGFPTSLRFP
jgi:hypothetical protein